MFPAEVAMAIDNLKAGPQFVEYFPTVLDALRALGGSARPAEVRDKVVELAQVHPDSQEALLKSGTPRFDNQIAWARFYLAKAGLIDSSKRGVWTLTDKGRDAHFDRTMAVEVFREVHANFDVAKKSGENADEASDEVLAPETAGSTTHDDHRARLLEILQALPPAGFERFCQRLLRESGFQDVRVTGKSGDGGIDGIGILQVNALVSFKVLFQCKRYQGSVSPSQVRDFRGAMQGRADKGIIITTGSFTTDAKKESVRDGVPPIELVDGEKLVEMLENLELGLRPVRAFEVNEAFFAEYSD